MTQEKKAKRFDEALEQLKGLIEGTREDRCAIVEEDIIDIFPELAESEDERIRQKFIKLVKMSSEVGGFALHKWEADEMLTWLEKQCEQKPKWTDEDDNMLYTIIADFKAFKHDNTSALEPHFNDCIIWLKSLKQRMEDKK